eukprot:scaffold84071_cov31-Tisochrysis_lutea.AAC.3
MALSKLVVSSARLSAQFDKDGTSNEGTHRPKHAHSFSQQCLSLAWSQPIQPDTDLSSREHSLTDPWPQRHVWQGQFLDLAANGEARRAWFAAPRCANYSPGSQSASRRRRQESQQCHYAGKRATSRFPQAHTI